MKGIVVEQNDKYAVILDKNGGFVKVKNRENYRIGHEIDIESKVLNFNFKTISKVASIAAAFALICGVSVGAYAYNTPYNYVSVDINPSMEFAVNIFDRVLEVKGINSDGEDLLKYKSYKNLKINEAIVNCIEEAVEEGFLGESDHNAVMITVSGKDNKKVANIKEELANSANVTLEQGKVRSEVLAEETTLDKRKAAKELGISPGKLVLIEKLKEVKPDVAIKEYKDKDVKEIVASIKETKKAVDEKKGPNLKVDKNDNKVKENEDKKINPPDKIDKNVKEKDKDKINDKDKNGVKNENKDKPKDKEVVPGPGDNKKNTPVEPAKTDNKNGLEKNKDSSIKNSKVKEGPNNKNTAPDPKPEKEDNKPKVKK